MADSAVSLPNTMVYLLGMPGTGKYTLAQKLAAQAGFRVIDNHLINNPVFTVVRVDGKTRLPKEIWDYTGRIGDVVFECVEKLSPPHFSFVLTNALVEGEAPDKVWFDNIKALADRRGALFVPVRLLVSDVEEHRRRITDPQREARMKETDATAPEKYAALEVMQVDHPNLLTLDTAALSAEDATQRILEHVKALLVATDAARAADDGSRA